MSDISQIDVDKAQEWLETGEANFIDIRDATSFSMGHIPKAVNINQDNIESYLKNTEKDKTLVICCYHGISSQGAARYFMDNGFKVANADLKNLDDFNNWVGELGSSNHKAWGLTLNFFENAGVLVRRDLLDIDMVAVGFAGMTRIYWEMMKPVILEQREAWGQPRLASEFEYLYDRLMKYMEEHPELKA